MRKSVLGSTIGVLLCFAPSSPAASADAPLQPVKPWDLDYGVTQCVALRQYGDPANPVSFAIVPAPNGDTYELLVGRKRVGSAFAQEFEGTVDFGNGPIKSWLLQYQSKDGKLMVDQFRISSQQMAQARSASSVTLHMQGAPDGTFELDHIPALMDGLEKCTADLKDFWNMDGDKDGRIATPARGEVRNVFNASDYPREAIFNRQQGDSQFLLLIDEKGKVAGCHVVLASGVPLLDAVGCAVIQYRAHFKPALDRNGKPVRSTVMTPKVRWQLA